MAVQLINDLPDVEVHHGDPIEDFLRGLNEPRASRTRSKGRAGFIAITVALHVFAALALLRAQFSQRLQTEPLPIEASIIETPEPSETPPPAYAPPLIDVAVSLPTPQELTIEPEVAPQISGTPITSPGPVTTAAPPMVDSVEYLRAEPPVYPRESQRRHEYGTVTLRVLVDTDGRPAKIDIEQSSGYERLDAAAREAVENFLFRPYEVNGIRQAAQVLIPIGFDPPRKG
jgi:TonB family protein